MRVNKSRGSASSSYAKQYRQQKKHELKDLEEKHQALSEQCAQSEKELNRLSEERVKLTDQLLHALKQQAGKTNKWDAKAYGQWLKAMEKQLNQLYIRYTDHSPDHVDVCYAELSSVCSALADFSVRQSSNKPIHSDLSVDIMLSDFDTESGIGSGDSFSQTDVSSAPTSPQMDMEDCESVAAADNLTCRSQSIASDWRDASFDLVPSNNRLNELWVELFSNLSDSP